MGVRRKCQQPHLSSPYIWTGAIHLAGSFGGWSAAGRDAGEANKEFMTCRSWRFDQEHSQRRAADHDERIRTAAWT